MKRLKRMFALLLVVCVVVVMLASTSLASSSYTGTCPACGKTNATITVTCTGGSYVYSVAGSHKLGDLIGICYTTTYYRRAFYRCNSGTCMGIVSGDHGCTQTHSNGSCTYYDRIEICPHK